MSATEAKNPISVAIGRRVAELRRHMGLSLDELARETGGLLSKSRLSNYEQGLRRLDIEGAKVLAEVFKTTPAHVLCLDDDAPIASPIEAQLIADMRKLPPKERESYHRRIATLALAYGQAVPDEVVEANGYNSPHRRKPRPKTP